MNLIRKELQKGVFFNAVQTDRFKTAILTVNLFVPLCRERASAYSLLTDVLMRGTEQYPTMEALNCKQDELYSLGLGAYVHKMGEAQLVTFEITCIEDAFAYDGMQVLAESIKLLQQLLFHPYTENGVFKHSYVEQEKQNLIDDLRSRINHKGAYARSRCIEEMCKGEAYAVECGGEESVVAALTAKDLWDAYTELLQQAHTEIFYVGRQDASYVSALCEQYLPFGKREGNLPRTAIGKAPAQMRTVREQMDVTQCKMYIGFRTDYAVGGKDPEKDPMHMTVFNEIFGGSPNSRLFLHIREQQSLCYSCSSHPDLRKGILLVGSGIEQKNEQKTLDAILAEWRSVCEGNVTAEELENARRSLRNAYREITDSPASICNWYLGRVFSGRTDEPEASIARIERVTLEDVIRAANSLHPDTVYYLEGEKEGAV